jgi:hypothetical protein
MHRIIRSALIIGLVSTAFAVGSVQAAPSGAVHLSLLRSGTDLSEIGWSSTGAITDAGDWSTQNRISGGSDASDAFVVAQVLTTEVGAMGTFHIRFQGMENHQRSFSGNWQLVNGSGAYAGITGTGHWTLAFDSNGNLDFELSGYVR